MYLIALLEHKSAVDYNVTMQLLRYMAYIWEDYEKEQEKQNKGISKTKDFRYPPILPIVYYEWTDRWTAVTDFRDRIFLNDVFEEFIPDYRYKLIKLSSYSDNELIEMNDEISFVMLIDRLKDNYEFRRLMSDLPEGYLDGISEMSTPDVLEVISRVVGVMLRRRNISEDRIEDLTEGIRSRPMGQLFEHWDSGPDEELIEKGRNEGSILHLISQIRKKLSKGMGIAKIADEVEEEKSVVEQICKIIEKNTPIFDERKIYEEYIKTVESQRG